MLTNKWLAEWRIRACLEFTILLRFGDEMDRSIMNGRLDSLVKKAKALIQKKGAKRISDEILNEAIDLQIKEDEAIREEQDSRPDLY